MPTDRPTVHVSNFALTRGIVGFVGDVPVKANEMPRLSAGRREDLDDIFQRLLDLDDEVVALELRLGIPANLASKENLSTLRGDAVGIAFWRRPMLRLHNFKRAFAHDACSRNLNR